MKFKELADLLLEGGNAIKSSSRINQTNVNATLDTIYKKLLPKLKLDKKYTASLGSTGKKKIGDSSGDIDLAIDAGALLKVNKINTPDDVYDFIIKAASSLTKEVADLRSIGLISIAWPIENIDGLQKNEFVQLDLMLVNSIEFAEWAYFSPKWDESPWKGGVRNELFFAIAKYVDYKALKKQAKESGEIVDTEWERNFYDLGKGLLKGIQTNIGKKGNPTKSVKTLDKWLLSNNPEEITKIFFGDAFSPSDVLTFENTYRAILSPNFVNKANRDKILKFAAQGMSKKPFPCPPEMKQYL